MRRMIHVWVCVALAYCQPAPSIAAELGVDDKGNPVLRLTPAEVAGCAQGCKLLTDAELSMRQASALSTGYWLAVKSFVSEQTTKPKEPNKCGRDA